MIYDGGNGGSVEVLENVLIIRRKGVASFLTQGLKGEKRIPFSSITSVQFKDPGLTTGYIQFGILGGMEGRGGVFNAAADENTVLFLKESLDKFRQLRNIVEGRISRSAQIIPTPAITADRFSEELTRLADLRDRGVLTQEEFAEEKSRLLSQRASTSTRAFSEPDQSNLLLEIEKHQAGAQPSTTPKTTVGQQRGKGCLIIIAMIGGLAILGAIIGTENDGDGAGAGTNKTEIEAQPTFSPETKKIIQRDGPESLTATQRNAVKSAEQYLGMSGF